MGDKCTFWNMGFKTDRTFAEAMSDEDTDFAKDKKYERKYQKRYDKKYDTVYDKKYDAEDVNDEDSIEDTNFAKKIYHKHYDKKYDRVYHKKYDAENVDDEDTNFAKDKHYERKYQKRYDKKYDSISDAEDVDDEDSIEDTNLAKPKHYDRKYQKRYDKTYDVQKRKLGKPALHSYTIFFAYNDLHAGKKMRLHITKSTIKAKFLTRPVADSIPFSSDKLSEILERFSVKPDSEQGKMIKETIEECEWRGMKGEAKHCPTSLESLVDFSVQHVGNKAQILFNDVADQASRVQEHTILDVKFVGENHVVCHQETYPFAVYYCHALNGTKIYWASLLGADGTKAKVVAVCHSDTSAWSPEHYAFYEVNMKPGDGTICHFIRSDTHVWVSTADNVIRLKTA